MAPFVAPAEAFALSVGGKLGADELRVADVDLDGLPETLFPAGRRVRALRDGGDLLWVSEDVGAWWMLGTADFDGDGRPEVAVATAVPGVAFLDGLEGRTIFASGAGDVSTLGTILPLDVEGDGAVELYVADDGCSHDGRGFGRVYGLAGGVVTRTVLRTETHDFWCGRDQVVADLDGDGRPEIVAPDEDRVWAYDPASGFSTRASGSLDAFPVGLVHTAVADLDRDGDDELILASDNPWRWYAAARRLQVLDAAGDELVSSWIVRVSPEAGGHRFLDAPAADVLASSAGLEVVSSIADSASSGWEVRVFRGLSDDGDEHVLAAIPDAVALGLADVDGDGLAEILARPAPDFVVDSAPSTISAFDVLEDGTTEELWSVPSSRLPLAPDPGGADSALPAAGNDGWGGPAGPIVQEGPAGLPAVLVESDGDGDGVSDRLALLDGPTGAELARWSDPDSALGPGGIIAVGRASGADVCLAAATESARVAQFHAGLALSNDADGGGVPDVTAANRAATPPIVPSGSEVVAAEAGGRVPVFSASCSSAVCGPARRSPSRLLSSEPRVAGAACDCTAEPFLVGAYRTNGGHAAVALFPGMTAAATTIDLGAAVEPVADALPVGPLDPEFPEWDTVALALYDPSSNRSSLALVSTGGARTQWMGLDADGTVGGPLAAADLDGDGDDELLAVRDGFVQVVSAGGEEVVRHEAWGGGSILAWDVGEGRPALFRTGADSFAVERLDTNLDRVWIAGEGTSHRGRLAAIAGGGDGTFRLGVVAEVSAELSAYAAEDGALLWRTALASGDAYPDVATAYAAGARPGVLSSPATAAATEPAAADTLIVGSSDGFLYGVSAADGSLAWSVALHAAVGEPVVVPFDDPGGEPDPWTAVLAPAADGLVHVVGEARLPAPVEVWDGDGVTDPASAADDIDESHNGAVAAAVWPASPEATAYLVQLVTDDDVVVRPWYRTEEPRFAARDLALRPDETYRVVVRAVSSTSFSRETSSDGFTILDEDVPRVEVTARPGRILPDVDGVDDTSTIGAALSDDVLLVRWHAEVQDAAGSVARDLGRGETGRRRMDVSLRWDGRDDGGRVVTGGPWRVVIVAEDSAGREGRGETTVWVCAGAALSEPACAEGGADAGPGDGGPDGPADAADGDGGDGDGGTGGGGCACRAGAQTGPGGGAAWLLVSILLARGRTRPSARFARSGLRGAPTGRGADLRQPGVSMLGLASLAAALLSCSAPPPPGTVEPADPLLRSRRDATAQAPADAGTPVELDVAEPAVEEDAGTPAPVSDAGTPTTTEATSGPEAAASADASSPAEAGAEAAAGADVAPSGDAADSRPPVPPPSDDPSAVVLRLGCSVITEGQLQRSVRLVRVFAGLAGRETTEEDDARIREIALERLGLEVIVRREAAARSLTATQAEVQAAAAMVAQGNGVEVSALFLAVEDQGLSNEEYEADLEFQILEMKVIQAYGEEVPVVVTDAEIEAEYLARTEGLDASVIRPLADVRDTLRDKLAADKVEIQGREWLMRRRDELERTRAVRASGGGCVEQPAESP
ncbi:MAG: PQQ-binding-like beta-propeller repeat protein [Deltaproteobacteria bacterium]|nr:PQQ-binding-like beta-propeller repeat protein [Deltaproteobacteria bacterium]